MKTKKIFLTVFVLLCVTCAFYYGSLHANEEKEIVFGISMDPFMPPAFGGKGAADAQELFQKGADEFKKQHGITISLKIFPAPKFLFKALQDKTIDFANMGLDLFLAAKNMNIHVHPFLTASTTGKKGEKFCLYVHKDSGIKTIKQLQGKQFVINWPLFLSKKDTLPPKESYIYWIILKKILIKNGVQQPFKDFFKGYNIIPSSFESIAFAVDLKKFDVFLASRAGIQNVLNYDPKFSELVPLPGCLDVPAEGCLALRDDVKMNVGKMVGDFFLHPSKALRDIQKEYKGIKLFAIDEKDYAVYFQWLKEAEQKGWLKEFDEIMKNTPRPKKKGGKEE